MRELDILFTHYLDKHYQQADSAEQLAFEALIETADPIITDYLFNRKAPPSADMAAVIEVMQSYL